MVHTSSTVQESHTLIHVAHSTVHDSHTVTHVAHSTVQESHTVTHVAHSTVQESHTVTDVAHSHVAMRQKKADCLFLGVWKYATPCKDGNLFSLRIH